MKRFLLPVGCALVISIGFVGLYMFTPKPAKMNFEAPEKIDQTFKKEMMDKQESCDKFCKERHKDPEYHIIGRLKSSPDGVNLICQCWRKKLTPGIEI